MLVDLFGAFQRGATFSVVFDLDAIEQVPFCKTVHTVLVRLPLLGHKICIAEVLHGATQWVLEIPKISRRDGVSTGANLSGPAFL